MKYNIGLGAMTSRTFRRTLMNFITAVNERNDYMLDTLLKSHNADMTTEGFYCTDE